MRIRTTVLTLALALAASVSAEAQSDVRNFQIAVFAGWQAYAGGSALKGGGTVGADATYFITPSIGVGVWTDYSLTEGDGTMFPPAALSFVDSTTFSTINQPVDIWEYGVHGKIRLPGSVSPYLLVGGGGYTVFLDSQQSGASETFTGFVARFGLGVDFAISDRAGFEITASDAFYPNWQPQKLFPVRAQFQNTRFPELNPDPDDLSDSVHNFRITAGVTLVPGS